MHLIFQSVSNNSKCWGNIRNYISLFFSNVFQIMENAEINNIIKIVGLQYKKNYEDEDSLKTLRYGKIMIMTDQVSYFRFLNWYQMCGLNCPRTRT